MTSNTPLNPSTETVPTSEEIITPPPPRQRLTTILLLCLFTIFLGILALYFEKITNIPWIVDLAYTTIGKTNPNILPPPTPAPTPTPTPSYLPAGKQTYAISGSSNGPKISSLTLDPLNAYQGDRQSLTLVASSNEQIVSISITIFSDTKKTTLPLTQIGNEWNTTWTLNDSVNNRYILRIDAIDSATSSSTLIAPRTNGPIHIDELK